MRSFIIIAALAAGLAGCNANLNPDVATPNQVYIGLNAYGVAVNTANVYLRSPSCTSKPAAALCQQVYTALKSARAARKQLTAQLVTNQTVSLTALQALQAAYAVIQTIPQN